MHNVPVPATNTPVTRAVASAAAALLLVSCGGGDDEPADGSAPASPSPSSTVDVPEDVSLTEGGEKLGFGEAATVVFEPNQQRGTVLELSVDKVVRGSLKDFSGFVLEPSTRSSTPYYAYVSVKNVGQSDVGGFAVPLYGVDDQNTLLRASAFTTSFDTCEPKQLPRTFESGDSFDSCLVYLAPDRGTLEAVSFRPSEDFDPITWTGKIKRA